MKTLLDLIAANRAGEARGIYAVCSAHPRVLDAAFCQARQDGAAALIEATANQVNQFGGYTGMKPADFRPYVEQIADQAGFPAQEIILGGDHLGPVCWRQEPAARAMARARDLVSAYVAAGFQKIHLDTSMACADDPEALSDETVAARAAELCAVAEATAKARPGESRPVYVIGTEVPPPGGAAGAMDGLQVTSARAVRETLGAHQAAFAARGLEAAWQRVIALVTQPGVEFGHDSVHDYAPEKARPLRDLIAELPHIVYEAHSTDYQPAAAYPALVRDHFAILKVGPQLTWALREALFALSHIEDELVAEGRRSNLRAVCEQAMLARPENWAKYYPRAEPEARLCRRYSYSDRIRYYWPEPAMAAATNRLLENLADADMPPPLLSQYMPAQYAALRAGELTGAPADLIRHRIMQVTGAYARACGGDG